MSQVLSDPEYQGTVLQIAMVQCHQVDTLAARSCSANPVWRSADWRIKLHRKV